MLKDKSIIDVRNYDTEYFKTSCAVVSYLSDERIASKSSKESVAMECGFSANTLLKIEREPDTVRAGYIEDFAEAMGYELTFTLKKKDT